MSIHPTDNDMIGLQNLHLCSILSLYILLCCEDSIVDMHRKILFKECWILQIIPWIVQSWYLKDESKTVDPILQEEIQKHAQYVLVAAGHQNMSFGFTENVYKHK
jgi:hypothetical protein